MAATVVAGTSFVIGQQILRTGANDPQVQLAEDAAAQLEAGVAPADVLPAAHTDIAASLAPWVMVYGPDRKQLAGSARLDGKVVEYPTSVFDNAPAGGHRDEVTWQPRSGVRAATVAVGFRGGWVVAGRSLRLVEEREDRVGQLAIVGWLGALAATAVAVLIGELVARRLERDERRQ
ncbi:MAG: hypothetical protein M3Z98_01735 [Candidatus Dormibacteraeota bacterium]|nr:hypothetical protein [Candidatus Dormibacteraeota bacterium]